MKKLSPIHPGTLLREDFMQPLGLSQNQLAKELHVPVTRIGEIVNGRRNISAETAYRLAVYFGTSVEYWLNVQRDYDREMVESEQGDEIRREVKPRAAHAAV